jgi:Flp pilus assembly protein TadG
MMLRKPNARYRAAVGLRLVIEAITTGADTCALLRDRRASVAAVTGLVVPVLVGFAGLGTEVGLWLYARQSMQGAADSAAIGAANAVFAGTTSRALPEAAAAAAKYGFVDGQGGVGVTVNRPPASGNFTANSSAVEVIIAQPQSRLFSAMFLSDDVTVRARAVAVSGNQGNACILALDPNAKGALTTSGTASVTLNGCSLAVNSTDPSAALLTQGSSIITADSARIVGGVTSSNNSQLVTAKGVITGAAATADPYAALAMPPAGSCDQTKFTAKNTVTLSPGVFCGGLKLNAGANVTLSPGTYVIDGGSFDVAGGATISGNGVTIVFTGSLSTGYATATINGGATVNLTAPTTGAFAGVAMFADRNEPAGSSFGFNGGSAQNITGAVYVPSGSVTYTGGAVSGAPCTQLVARTINFGGNAVLNQNCTGIGTKSIGSTPTALVE